MNDKVRKTLPLVGAIALTSSALLAGTGGVAAKPAPTAEPDNGFCQYLPTSDETQYRVGYNLSGNKGKWVFVRAELQVGDDDPVPAYPTTSTKWNKNSYLPTEAKVKGGKKSATMTLFFEDRRGNVVASVPKAFCG